MKKYLDYAGNILLIAGIIEIIIGILHFIMPYFALGSNGYTLLSRDELNFLIHAVIAVGFAMVPFGLITILFSLKKEALGRMLLYYCIIKSVLWGVRIISEIILPVNISLFYINKPTTLILPFCILVWLLFAVPVVSIIMGNKKMAFVKSV